MSQVRPYLQSEQTHLHMQLVHPGAVGFVGNAVRGFHFHHVQALFPPEQEVDMANDVMVGVSDFNLFFEGGAAGQEIIPEHGLRGVPSVKDEHLFDGVFNRQELAKYRLAGTAGNVGGPGVGGAIRQDVRKLSSDEPEWLF